MNICGHKIMINTKNKIHKEKERIRNSVLLKEEHITLAIEKAMLLDFVYLAAAPKPVSYTHLTLPTILLV